MPNEDLIGQRVRHVREPFEGTVVELMELPDPFPQHALVRDPSLARTVAWPVNQLVGIPPERFQRLIDAAGAPAESDPGPATDGEGD